MISNVRQVMPFHCSKPPIILRIKSTIPMVISLKALHILAPTESSMVSIISNRKLVVFYTVIPLNVINFSLFSRLFSLSFIFGSSATMYLTVFFSIFILLGLHWAPRICRLMSFINFRKFLAIIFSQMFLLIILSSKILITHKLGCLMLFHRSYMPLLFILFL